MRNLEAGLRRRAELGAPGPGRRVRPRRLRPRRPASPDPAPGGHRARRRLARGPGRRRRHRLPVGGPRRLGGPGRVPLRLLRQREEPARRRARSGRAGPELGGRGRRPAGRRAAADERGRPAPGRAGGDRGRGRGQRRPEPVPLRGRRPRPVARRPAGRHPRPATLPVWRGELRSAARAPLLSGVISNRVDVRAAAAAAERAVERRAEPLLALFRPARGMGGGRTAPGRRLGPADRQQRPRLGLRLLHRRRGRPGPGPLRRGPPDRRRAGRPGAGRPGRRDGEPAPARSSS